MNSVLVAHVADTIEVINGGEDFDTDADTAARLLAANPDLVVCATAYSNGTIGVAEFEAAVRRALPASGGPA